MSKKIKKKEIAPQVHEGEPYFVYLKNPLEYRRQLLESSRKTIYALKSHQKILSIRQKKFEEMRKLRTSIKELLYLNRKFNEKLPKYDNKFLEGVRTEDKTKPVKILVTKVRKPAVPIIKREKSDMDRLEESLAGIEKKLRNLQ